MMHGVAMNRPACLCLLAYILLLPAEPSAQSALGCYVSRCLLVLCPLVPQTRDGRADE